ncbi:uncharacterized protein A4U43_C07F24020 [Asparagus officinalis]|uniref:Ionotropic glutamate receptor C-terminal domain-containing protein n=2 Tax=Asparagus officinalis TaxID=4686 RepID=A0A5P1EHF6_ASPOF|nr:uncharacterized protein A4U43_C07F24020 [Asparagus officinalis]
MESRVIVVHANPELGLTIFSVAHNHDMLMSGYVWIATDWLAASLDPLGHLGSEITSTMQGVIALRQHTADSKSKVSLVSRWKKLIKEGNDGNYQLNAYGLYAYDTVWVIARAMDAFFNDGGNISFSSDPRLRAVEGGHLHLDAMSIFDDGDLLLDKLRSTNLSGVTGHVQFDSNGYLIHPAYDIINVIGSGSHIVGFWSNYTGLSIATPEALYENPANRSAVNQQLRSVVWPGETTAIPRGWVFPNNGKQLRIIVPNRVSYRDFVSKAPGTGAVDGFCIDVFLSAVNLLPYAVPHKFVAYGNGRENPDYNELVDLVGSNVYDAAVGDIVITTNRTKYVDFTQPYAESGLVILAPVKRQASNPWAFLQPFTLEMWCVTGVFFLVVGSVIWILEHRINDEFRGPPQKQVVTVFWFSFSTLFFSHRENTVSTLGRVVLIIWLFVVLIIQSSYTASLTSILTVQRLSSSIRGIDSLIASKEPIGFQVGSFAENYMVYELGIERSRLRKLGSPEAYARALDLGPDNGGVAAVVDERLYVDLFLSTNCKYTIVGQEFTRTGWGFAFPRDSQLAVDMSTAILTLSENGDLQRIHDKWLIKRACDSENDELDSERLHFSSFWGLFLICGLACFFSLLIFFVLMLKQFRQHVPPPTPESSGRGGSSLHTFLSFVDTKAEDSTAKRKQAQKGVDANGIDVEG